MLRTQILHHRKLEREVFKTDQKIKIFFWAFFFFKLYPRDTKSIGKSFIKIQIFKYSLVHFVCMTISKNCMESCIENIIVKIAFLTMDNARKKFHPYLKIN